MTKDEFINVSCRIREILSISRQELIHAEFVHENLYLLIKHPPLFLRLAALGHDIDRCVPTRCEKLANETYDEYKVRHALRSAELVRELMIAVGIQEREIEMVISLIRIHEVGGNRFADILCEADSLAFFEFNSKKYLSDYGYSDAAKKVIFMYKRVSDRTKRLILSLDLPEYVREVVMDYLENLTL